MLQDSVGASTAQEGSGAAPPGRRARNRLARTRSYLAAALHIVSTEGLHALTMQRVADEVDCAIGTIYSYFPSKGALLAEVQRAAIDRLTESYLLGRADLERTLGDALDDPERALARLIAFGRFWIAAVEAYPRESHLQQMLLTAGSGVMNDDDAARVVPSAMRLLDQARACLEDAVRAGVLAPGDSMERVVVWAAAVSGVLQLSNLSVHDDELFDGARLARQCSDDLLLAWGAPHSLLTRVDNEIDDFARSHALAPRVPDDRREER